MEVIEEFNSRDDTSFNIYNKNPETKYKLSEREKKTLNKVLARYDFDVLNIIKVKKSYKIYTSIGNICLKKVRRNKYKSKNESVLSEELLKKGFLNNVKYLKDRYANNYIKLKDSFFYATEWIDGEECDLNNIDEAVQIIKLLAQYHVTFNNIDIKKLKIKDTLKDWSKYFKGNLQDIEKFERSILKRKMKNEFDTVYYNYIESMYNKGITALNILNTSDYYKLLKHTSKNKVICNDSFYYGNIIKKHNNYYITSSSAMKIDFNINDLANILKKLMLKRTYKWDFEKAKLLIKTYNSVNKLNKNEIQIMLALMIFPYKFWKLGKKRYIKHKDWDEKKYMHKLDRLTRYNDEETKFIQSYLIYIENYK
jgi:CotS family spore coat protein